MRTILGVLLLAASLGRAQTNSYPLNRVATITSGTTIEVIAVPTGPAASRPILIGWLFFAWDNSASWDLKYGTGTNCGTGTTIIRSGGSMTAFDFYPGSSAAPIVVPPGRAVCLVFSTAVSGKGSFSYAN